MQKNKPGRNNIKPNAVPHGIISRASSLFVTDNIRFYMFGLGKGVDASDPSPLSCSCHHEAVRTIHPTLSNIMENTKKEKHSYEEYISSLTVHRSFVKASVSDVVGKVVTLQAEAEYKRQNSQELVTSGMQLSEFLSVTLQEHS